MKSTALTDIQLIRRRSILALFLIVPISSIAAMMSTIIAPGSIGQGIAIGCGVWMLVLPISWHRFVDRQKLNFRLSKPAKPNIYVEISNPHNFLKLYL
jgi:hypothetical protein